MKKLLILFVFWCSNLFAETSTYKQIIINKPNICKKEAQKIAKVIKKVRNTYKIPEGVLVAILMQESAYRLNAINQKSKDYGISQINQRTIASFGLDRDKLTTNLEYSIEAAGIVLADFKKRHAHKDPLWFARYNHSKPEIKQKYFEKIKRWMPEHVRENYEKK